MRAGASPATRTTVSIAISWTVALLCIAVCFQVLGVPWTLFDFTDSDDVFRLSVMAGFALVSCPAWLSPWLLSSFATLERALIADSLQPFSLFHPPLSIPS
jgi:hypothetical protein